ncbi:MAG: carbon-nitrogen hydrolase family protein, partial [Streptomycetaceae bacterium]|nr:carbon-nitrogen hydrolase family protein [Streptomycetaceae bacterium]
LAELRGLAVAAARAGARVVVAPEYAMFGVARLDERVVAAAEPVDGPFVTGLGELASELGVHLVAGFAERLPDDRERVHNTVVAIGPDAAPAAVYRKVHLFDAFGFTESDIVAPGPVTEPAVFTADGIRIGLQTCYDLRFPESVRRIAVAGADVLALPAQWIPGPLKEDHWTTLLRARAIENTFYVAAADHAAPRGAGNSMIVDPMGIVVANLGDRTGIAAAPVSAARLRQVRTANPCLQLRRLPPE